MNAKEAYKYAKNVVKGRCEKCEEILLNFWDSSYNDYCILYANNVIKGRWEELEKIILKQAEIPKKGQALHCSGWNRSIEYARCVIKGRWPELEEKLLNLAKVYLFGDFYIDYCQNCLKGRWPELENLLEMNEFEHFYFWVKYSEKIIKGRWEELEEKLLKNSKAQENVGILYLYAQKVIKGRWIEAEKFIKTDPHVDYAKNIIKDRWKEAEPFIEQKQNQEEYYKFIRDKIYDLLNQKDYEKVLSYFDYKYFSRIIKNAEKKHYIPDVVKNAIIANCIGGNDKESVQFMKQDKIFRKKMKDYLEKYKGVLVDKVIQSL